jgi:tetratricopeptide (TPR) repeat protein
MTQPINPYIAGNPLRDERGFFGRQDTLQWVSQELHNPTTNALVLAGPRRIGKTSLLLQLERILPKSSFLPIYVDLQDKAKHPLQHLLSELATKIAKSINWQLPNPESFDDEGLFFRGSFLPQLYDVLDRDCRPVFLLDGFDVFDQTDKDNLSDNAAAKALFPLLRNLLKEDPRLAFLFAVELQTEDLSLNFAVTLKASLRREIWVLDKESAELMVRQAEVNGTLRFTERAVESILNLTNNHPYLTQLLCQRIWERAYNSILIHPPQIDVPEVEAAVPDALESGHQAFAWLWEGLSPAEKIYSSALAEAAQNQDETISEDQVIHVLTTSAPRLRIREVELAPRDLIKRWVLVGSEKGGYRFAVELVHRWIQLHKPLRDVKEELDRIDPSAEQLFILGMQNFQRGQMEDAIDYFQRAIKANSQHFRARLNLGETLLRLNRADEAVAVLEFAYELDENETRLLFARALMAQAKTLEEKGQKDAALASCERALKLSPSEQVAQRIRTTIWIQRGNEAMEQGELEKALSAYQQIGANRWEEAIAFVERTLAESPTLFRTRFHLGEVLLLLDRVEAALALINTTIGISKQESDSYIEEMDSFLREELKKRPKFTFARLQLGQLLLTRGQIRDALDQFEEAYEEGGSKSDPIMPHLLLIQAEAAHVNHEWFTAFTACVRALKIDPSLSQALDIMDHSIIEWKKRKILNSSESQRLEEDSAFIQYSTRNTLDVNRHQLHEILLHAEGSVRLLGVVPLNADKADWQTLANKWAVKVRENPEFKVQILCESDNMLFSKSFTCDTDAATNRLSFRALQFIRDRASSHFLDFLQAEGVRKESSQINVEIMHLPIPVSVVQVDDKIFINLWLQEAEDYFEEITQLHPWRAYLDKYIAMYFAPKIGLKYACDPKDEVLELFDRNQIPRGIYPRSSFYDTDFPQLVVWALIFDRQGRLLIHRRADNAKDNQGMWDKSVGGHTILSDINTSEAITREVIEELFSEEIKQSKAELTVLIVTDQDMIYLGAWRPAQRQAHPFYEIKSFSREWAFFWLGDTQRQHLYSPRILPKEGVRDLRIIADVFLFVAGPQLTENYIKKLKNSTFKLLELSELKDAIAKSRRGEKVVGFYKAERLPKFSPDLINIMTGDLYNTLMEFSQYIKEYLQ